MKQPLIAYTDGAVRGKNQSGNSAWAFVVQYQPESETIDPHKHSAAALMNNATNNEAEYTAFIKLMRWALSENILMLQVYSDSQLMVNQMNGQYVVQAGNLKALWEEANKLRKGFRSLTLEWIPREENHLADAACNLVLDGAEIQ